MEWMNFVVPGLLAALVSYTIYAWNCIPMLLSVSGSIR